MGEHAYLFQEILGYPADIVILPEIIMLFEELHRQGNTIILVTHEADIAEHAHRAIRLRDGKVESDQRVLKRKSYPAAATAAAAS